MHIQEGASLLCRTTLIELGLNVRAFDIIATNMGTGRQYLEAHYVRKGVMQDEDALVTAGGTRRTTTAGEAEVQAASSGLDVFY